MCDELPFTDAEFQEALDRLVSGMPAPLVVTRLVLALQFVCLTVGREAFDALLTHISQRDEQEAAEIEGLEVESDGP